MNTLELKLRLERYILAATILFNIKREYLTLGLPILIAALFIAFAVSTGHTFSLSATSDTSSIDVSFMDDQYNQTGPKYDLDQVIIIAFMIATFPYTIDTYRQKRILKKKELEFSNILYKLSELMRGGIDPVKGMIAISRGELGILKKDVQDCASSLVLGQSLKYSMNRLRDAIGSKLVAKYINIVIQASLTGGNVSDLVFRTSEDMRAVIALDKEKEGNLKQYVVVFYMAQGILLGLVYVLSTSLLPMVQGTGMSMFGGSGAKDINFTQGFFHMIIINALLGGLIIGMITEGDLKQGLKHSNILILSSYIACFMLMLSPPLPTYNIKVVSGGDQILSEGGSANPIAFSVTDSSGKPVPNQIMAASIKPSGMIESQVTTTKNGIILVHPVVDNGIGIYNVRVGSSKSSNYTNITFGSVQD